MNSKTIIAGLSVTLVALLALPGSSAVLGGVLWTSDGANNSWTYDPATDGWTTGPEYQNQECSYIENEPVPGILLAGSDLSFTHSFDIEGYWDAGAVALSKDGGNTFSWLPVGNSVSTSSLPQSCFSGLAGSVPASMYSGNWPPSSAIVDLGAIAPDDEIVVRFVLATDYSVTYSGWEITNVELGGVPIMGNDL